MLFDFRPGVFPAIHLADVFSLLHLIDRKQPRECELFRLALAQTGFEIALYTEQDAETAFRFLDGQWMAPAVVQLRASNEESLRPRVARAQDHAGVVHSVHSASTGEQSGLPSLI